ncbi:MAG: GNAT family N-acetyltransferase [Candidatus Bathyarchaeia archaeon]
MIAQIRNFEESDLPFLLELLKEPDSEQRLLYMHYGNGNFSSWLKERSIKVLIAENNNGIIGSAAYNDGFWGEEIEWLVTCGTPDRKLVENMLIREAEKYVKRDTVFTSVNAGSSRVEEWVQRGYCPNGGLYYMITKLSRFKSIPKIPEGVLLRCLKPEEENEFVQVVNAGFGWERVKLGDIEKWKAESPPFDEEWIYVAESDGKLVSVVVAKPDIGYNRFFNANRGYLGPAATLPEYRGKNLASALTVHAMNSLFKQGMDSVCLFTNEANAFSIKLLQKIGFQIGFHWKFMLKHF